MLTTSLVLEDIFGVSSRCGLGVVSWWSRSGRGVAVVPFGLTSVSPDHKRHRRNPRSSAIGLQSLINCRWVWFI